MKTQLITFLFLISLTALQAQDFFAPIGATWHYNDQEQQEFQAHGYVLYTAEKDTIVNDFEVRKISVQNVRYNGESEQRENMFLQVADSQVFLLEDSELSLIFDYTAKEGDTLNIRTLYGDADFCDSVTPIIVDSIRYLHLNEDSLLVQHSSYSIRYFPTDDFTKINYTVTERVGTTGSFLRTPYEPYESRWTDGSIRCYTDDNIEYRADWWLDNYGDFNCDTLINDEVSILEHSTLIDIKITPNPSSSTLTIDFNDNKPSDYQVEIVSVLGQVYLTKSNETQFNVEQLPSGLYIVKVKSDDNILGLSKFIKK